MPDDVIPEPEGIPDDQLGRTVDQRFEDRIEMAVPDRHNPTLHRLMELVNADDDLYGLWLAANVTAMERLGMTDHGPVHVKIIMNIAVKILRLIMDRGVDPGVVKNWGMEADDAEVVVALAAMLHDAGMSIHRADHEEFSLFLADRKLREILPELYGARTATIVHCEVLHAIIAHRSGGTPLTLEAGIVRVADALDMAKGRSRIPFESGSTSIHSISAAAIEGVEFEEGAVKPVRLIIHRTHSAGVFQLDQLFRGKLQGSGIEEYVELEAQLEGETEKRIMGEFRI